MDSKNDTIETGDIVDITKAGAAKANRERTWHHGMERLKHVSGKTDTLSMDMRVLNGRIESYTSEGRGIHVSTTNVAEAFLLRFLSDEIDRCLRPADEPGVNFFEKMQPKDAIERVIAPLEKVPGTSTEIGTLHATFAAALRAGIEMLRNSCE